MRKLNIQITHAARISIARLALIHFRFFFLLLLFCYFYVFEKASNIFIMILLATIQFSKRIQLPLCLMRLPYAYLVYFRLIWFSYIHLYLLTVLFRILVIHNDAFVRCGDIGRTSQEGKWIVESYIGQEARQARSTWFGLWLWHQWFRCWLFGRRSWIASRSWRCTF